MERRVVLLFFVLTTALCMVPGEFASLGATGATQCGPADTFIADPTSCVHYYWCPMRVRMPCPMGTMFSSNTLTCMQKEFVTCHTGLTCPAAKGLFPHPKDSSKFLLCYGNVPYVQKCGVDLLYNSATKFCDFKDNTA